MKPLPIMEKQNALLITIPKSTKWEEYQKELDAVKSEEMEMNFKVSSLTGEFHELKKKIPYKGFQGYRYFDYSNID